MKTLIQSRIIMHQDNIRAWSSFDQPRIDDARKLISELQHLLYLAADPEIMELQMRIDALRTLAAERNPA